MKKTYFQHDGVARNDPDIRMLERAIGNNVGYALYFKTLEYMFENDGFLESDHIWLMAESCKVSDEEYQEFLDKTVELNLFKIDDDGSYYSDRLCKHIDDILKTSDQNSKNALKRWAGNKEVESSSPKPKKPKPKKEPAPEIPPETQAQIKELRGYVQNMIDDYPDSKNGKNDLTDSQYVRLLDKYGRDKLVEMQKVFFEWKLGKSERVKTTDYGTLIRDTGWVATQAGENINANKPLASEIPQEQRTRKWVHPFPEPEGFWEWGHAYQSAWLNEQRRIAAGGDGDHRTQM